MQKLTDHLLTQTPVCLDFSAGVSLPQDPVAWGLEMMRANQPEAAMQLRETPDSPEVTYLDEKDPSSLYVFQQRIEAGEPVHGRLALVDICSGEGSLRENADWAWEMFNNEFKPALDRLHPMGYYMMASMWMSCGDHTYGAHCDLADGYLVHMSGHKRVRVWPMPEKYLAQPVFQYSDFEGRTAGEYVDYELEPGQVLFLPGGAMHEVVAEGSDPCVSVSFHMGSPHPLLVLRAQLNHLIKGGGDITLPVDMQGMKKFELWFFEPTRHFEHGGPPGEQMPDVLADALLQHLHSERFERDFLRELLSLWWQIVQRESAYSGPYPQRLSNQDY